MSWEQLLLISVSRSPECYGQPILGSFGKDKGAGECKQLSDWMQRQGSGGSRKFVIAAMPAFGGHSIASCSWRPVSIYFIQSSCFGQHYRSKI